MHYPSSVPFPDGCAKKYTMMLPKIFDGRTPVGLIGLPKKQTEYPDPSDRFLCRKLYWV